MDEETENKTPTPEKGKEEEGKTVDELVAEVAKERDKYKNLYEKEREAHARTLRGKLLGGNATDEDEDEENDADDENDVVKKLKAKYKK